MPAPHESELVELPVLVAVGTEPVARIVVPFVGEAHRDAISLAGPDFLDEPVVELPGPLALQEFDDGRAPGEELRAVAPRTIYRVRQRDPLGIARVPRILRRPRLLRRRLPREWRERRAA